MPGFEPGIILSAYEITSLSKWERKKWSFCFSGGIGCLPICSIWNFLLISVSASVCLIFWSLSFQGPVSFSVDFFLKWRRECAIKWSNTCDQVMRWHALAWWKETLSTLCLISRIEWGFWLVISLNHERGVSPECGTFTFDQESWERTLWVELGQNATVSLPPVTDRLCQWT